jgi:hypothetical protein
MELKEDALHKLGEDLKREPGGAFQIRPPNWAQHRNDYYRAKGWAKFLWNNLRPFYIVYGLSTTGAAVAIAFWYGAVALQNGQGFFNLGLGLGTFDALLFLVSIACGLATLGGVVWAFIELHWVCKIVALYFFYTMFVWMLHGFQVMEYPLGAYFFCVVVSVAVEGVLAFWQGRMNS